MTAVTFIVGARPNFMKVAPVQRALEAADDPFTVKLVDTGQHYDEKMSAIFFDELGLPEPDLFLGVGSGSHAEQTARALVAVEAMLVEDPVDLLVVPGDVNSTLAAALAAVKLEIPVADIEAGLRSRDWSMPEEHNRVLTDHMSSLLLAHSDEAVSNLASEGIDPRVVRLVGNTMVDSLFQHLESALSRRPWASYGVERGNYVLVTLHRPALVDDEQLLQKTADALVELVSRTEVVFPVHPRTHKHLREIGALGDLQRAGVVVCEPVGYLEFIGLEASAAAVITDSGGVQEETAALGVPCFTLRNGTERPVTVELGTNTILGLDPGRIRDIEIAPHSSAPAPIPLWDGRAGVRAAEEIRRFLVSGGRL